MNIQKTVVRYIFLPINFKPSPAGVACSSGKRIFLEGDSAGLLIENKLLRKIH